MFYSQFILAKKGPLGTIWIAAHLERKLRKNQVADTDIGVSVDSILFPDVPIALRLSSHLLLGVVRIYNRKVNYLFDDCSEALLKVKQAFRSTAVDLPPEESKAPYHSITLPEKFDLDDFELPDSDIFQGNYVDHHISSREQITLQDTMEGVSYSTSKFGLDERFGDGDMSGLDLEEELLLGGIDTAEHADERQDPQGSFGSTSTLKLDQHPEDRAANSEAMVDGGDVCDDIMDYAQAPSTPGLMDEPNFSKVQEASACDDHLESEYHLTGSTLRENMDGAPYEDKQEVDWCSRNDTLSDVVPQRPLEENGFLSGGFEVKESEPQGQVESIEPTSECANEFIKESDVLGQTEVADNKDRNNSVSVDGGQCKDQVPNEVSLDVSKDASAENVPPQDVEDPTDALDTSNLHCVRELASEGQDKLILGDPDTHAIQGIVGSGGLNLHAHDEEAATESIVLRPCTSVQDHTDVAKLAFSPSNDCDVKSDIYVKATDEVEETAKIEHHASGEDILAAAGETDGMAQATAVLPAPEKLLSVPENHLDLHSGMMEVSPGDFEGFDEGDTGSKTAAGRKRTFTESTVTEQSLNSVESSRHVRIKQTAGSVPDDDDLLSSILVGRRTSILKVKPTPPPYEVTSLKRSRAPPRSGAPKRKVLMDDTMVLHGDAIRQQLTITEDIRRVRKKAPCTLSEISMIRKQHMEDETFLEPVFTGMSIELTSLHGQVYDLSRIKVCQNEVHDASLEFVSEKVLPSQTVENASFPETMVEPNMGSRNEKSGDCLETVAEFHSTSPNNRSHDMEDYDGSGKTNAIEVTEEVLNNEFLTIRDNETAEPRENHLPSENKIEEVDSVCIAANEEWTKPTTDMGTDDSHNEQVLNTAVMNFDAMSDMVHASDGIIQMASANEYEGKNAYADTDTAVVYDQWKAVPSTGLDFADVDHEQAIMNEGKEKDDNGGESETELLAKDYILPDTIRDAAAELIPDAGGLEYCIQSELYTTTSQEHLEVEFPCAGLESMRQGGSLNTFEGPDHPEAYQLHMMDGEISGFDLHDQDELNYLDAGNDTEFLNVDDDELAEMADDYMPDDEDTKYNENSGWSSRTRAVSKYLQVAFVKEADSGRNSLSLDKLLIGKSRKEASRMFFETLVLKTRDYIHVEQRNACGDITLRPRTRLMKSDF